MLEEFRKALVAVREAHTAIYKLSKAAHLKVETSLDLDTLADACFVARSCAEFLDDNRKEFEAMRYHATHRLCVVWLNQQTGEPVRTEYCTVIPTVKMRAELPNRRKNPEGFAALMDFFKIDRELWDVPLGTSPAIDLHFIGMLNYVTDLAEEGKPLPPGIDPASLKPFYSVKMRSTGKEITLSEGDEIGSD